MGMYNEVYKSCPNCGRRCEIQIYELVNGFGCFDLDNPDSLGESLDEEQLKKLHEAVLPETFWCQADEGGCGRSFMLGTQIEDRKKLAKELFGSL